MVRTTPKSLVRKSKLDPDPASGRTSEKVAGGIPRQAAQRQAQTAGQRWPRANAKAATETATARETAAARETATA